MKKFLWMVFALAHSVASPAASPVQSVFEQRSANLVLQQFDLSCGAAALATLLRYQHGLTIDERQVALGLVSRDVYLANPEIIRIRQGFSLLDMKRFTDSLGFVGVALGGMSYEDLLSQAPAIVPVTTHGSNHFVVFRGERDGKVLIADPAFGNRTMSAARFRHIWTRYADYGYVAFAVRRPDKLIPPNRLGVKAYGRTGTTHHDR
jgi:predicted double-glycine peptidase